MPTRAYINPAEPLLLQSHVAGQVTEMTSLAAVLFLFCFLLNAKFADAHSNSLDKRVCSTFEVGHADVSAESTKTVQIELLQNGASVNCFQRQTEYESKLNARFFHVVQLNSLWRELMYG